MIAFSNLSLGGNENNEQWGSASFRLVAINKAHEARQKSLRAEALRAMKDFSKVFYSDSTRLVNTKSYRQTLKAAYQQYSRHQYKECMRTLRDGG